VSLMAAWSEYLIKTLKYRKAYLIGQDLFYCFLVNHFLV
jgi:hypothetical protein